MRGDEGCLAVLVGRQVTECHRREPVAQAKRCVIRVHDVEGIIIGVLADKPTTESCTFGDLFTALLDTSLYYGTPH